MFPLAVKKSLGKTQQPQGISAPCQLLAVSAIQSYKKKYKKKISLCRIPPVLKS